MEQAGEPRSLFPQRFQLGPLQVYFSIIYCSCSIFNALPNYSSYSRRRSSTTGQADHVPPFSPLDVVEQYTNSINDESSSHVPDNQDLMKSTLPPLLQFID
jgi:hypothetical protein